MKVSATKLKSLLSCLVATALILFASSAAADYEPVTIEQLLEPCIEGDNDSRDGAVLEMECEQYIHGLLDAYLILNPDQKLCFPELGEPVDEVRREFMKWAYKNYSKREESATRGLQTVLQEKFHCQ